MPMAVLDGSSLQAWSMVGPTRSLIQKMKRCDSNLFSLESLKHHDLHSCRISSRIRRSHHFLRLVKRLSLLIQSLGFLVLAIPEMVVWVCIGPWPKKIIGAHDASIYVYTQHLPSLENALMLCSKD